MEVTEALEDISDATDLQAAFDSTDCVFRAMPRLMCALNEHYTKKLVGKTLVSLQGLATKCMGQATKQGCSTEELQAATNMLTKASTVFPFEACFGSLLSDLGSILTEKAKGDKIKTLVDAMARVVDSASLLKEKPELQKQLVASNGGKVNDAQNAKAALKVLDVCIGYLVEVSPDGEFMGEVLDLSVRVNESLAEQFSHDSGGALHHDASGHGLVLRDWQDQGGMLCGR